MKLLFTMVLLGASQVSMAGVFDLRFPRVAPADDQQSCLDFAQATAQELSAQSGATIIDVGCRADIYTNRAFDAIITYQADRLLRVTSTDTGSVYLEAYYTNEEACTAQLESQKQAFANGTGLQPLAAYCKLSLDFRTKWITRVDGIGTSDNMPVTVGITYWGVLVDEDATLKDFRLAALDYGLTVFEGGISHGSLGKKIVLRLYAPTFQSLEDYDRMKFATPEECAAAKANLDVILAPTHKPVVKFCELNSNLGGVALHAVSFVKSYNTESVFYARALASQYSTFSDCQQALSRFSVSAEIYGGICAGFGGNYQVHLFTRP